LKDFWKKSFRLWTRVDGFFSIVVRKAVGLRSAVAALKLLLNFLKDADPAPDGATPSGLLASLYFH